MQKHKAFILFQSLCILLLATIVYGVITFTNVSEQRPLFALTPQQQQPVSPTPEPKTKVRFANIGDYGWRGPHEAAVANLVGNWQPDFIVTNGDNNYPDGRSADIDNNIGAYYHEYIYPYTGSYGKGATANHFFPALGDHDWYNVACTKNICTGPYFDYFALPGNERYYDFAQGPVHIFILNSHAKEPDGFLSTSLQGAWLQKQLAAAKEPWKVVISHHPPYSSGSVHGSISSARWPYKAWGANVVISGNDHTYERLLVGGLPYFVNGLGGNTPYTFTTPALTESQVRYNGDDGALLAEATPLTLTFRFVNAKGALIDTYTLASSTVPSVTNASTVTNCLDTRIQHGADDVEEKAADGSQYIDSSDLEMTNDATFRGVQIVGLRFEKVKLPAHAKIMHAALEFTASETNSEVTTLVFQGAATANAAAFSSTPYAVSSLKRTKASVTWKQVKPWTKVGATYQTPDLAAVVQEVVDNPSWQSGNALTFIVSGPGHRTAIAFEGKVAAAARLLVEYGQSQPACAAKFTNLP